MRRTGSRMRRQEALYGYAFISPWLIGMLLFTVGPLLASLAISFCKWDLLTTPRAIGTVNYARLAHDAVFYRSIAVTAYYTAVSVPLGLAASLGLALMLNCGLRGTTIYRTVFYMPHVLSGVAVLLLWRWLLEPNVGLINTLLRTAGVAHPPGWLTQPEWSIPGLIFMGLWGVGGGMLIFLAGLQNIPETLYEAALIDGAGPISRFRHVTLPLLTPTVFFLLVMGVIGSFQAFNAAFVMTGGGPADSTRFYVLYLFQNAFQNYEMGLASAMAWVLFVVVFVLTLVQFRLSRRWVFYG